MEGDRIFLFGFSRGAFTVRALAALIHVCGLLRPDDLHLAADALELFATAESRIREDKKSGKIDLRNFDSEPIDHAKFDRKAFTGDRSDVGGGHDKGNNRLTDITLGWMLGEATNHGLLLDESKREPFEKLMKPNSESLPQPRNLDRGFQWWLSKCPRPELNNGDYPPSRPFKFKPSAARQPLDHTEKSRLRYHTTTSQGDEETLDVKWPEHRDGHDDCSSTGYFSGSA